MNTNHKRTAAEAAYPPHPTPASKRQRSASGLARPVTPPRPATPARPPRMPRFSSHPTDRKLVQQLHMLSAPELVALVKDVEMRYRKLATFEAEEIRRAQALGFGRNSPLVVRKQTTAW
eukprot:GFKZ01013767.1.p1 GENE.GFKZ01013767.1~~GFKZ01013767.1.p1  ORF type:complete len:129 (+),score=10.37 GFKZ01013767.1:32-388(+)